MDKLERKIYNILLEGKNRTDTAHEIAELMRERIKKERECAKWLFEKHAMP